MNESEQLAKLRAFANEIIDRVEKNWGDPFYAMDIVGLSMRHGVLNQEQGFGYSHVRTPLLTGEKT